MCVSACLRAFVCPAISNDVLALMCRWMQSEVEGRSCAVCLERERITRD